MGSVHGQKDRKMGRLIDEDDAIRIVELECGEWIGLAKEISKQFKQLPSAQEEIIRCKDCKHYKAYYYTGCLACHLVEGKTVRRDLDDFCSRAERLEE